VCVYWCSQNRTKSAEDIIKLDKAVVLDSMAVHQHNRNVGYEVQEEEHVTVLQRWRALTRGCCRGGRRRAVVHYPLGACDVPNHPPTNHPYIQWIFAAVPPLRDALNAVPCNPVTGLMTDRETYGLICNTYVNSLVVGQPIYIHATSGSLYNRIHFLWF